MKKSLSKQFTAILLIPIIVILAANFYVISCIRTEQNENLKRYCSSTLNNIKINIGSMTTSMKKTATMFSSAEEIQSYLLSASKDTHQLQRQSLFELIDLSKSYTLDLVDIIVWDQNYPTSLISYIPADMENFTVDYFQNTSMNTDSYFEFYIQPVRNEPFLIYFTPVFMTTFSKDFGKYLGNMAIICKTNTLNKLVNSTTDMCLNITDETNGQVLYSNDYPSINSKAPNQELHKEVTDVSNTNLSITGIVYMDQVHLLSDSQSEALIMLAVLSLFYLLYIAFAVQRFMIRPIHKLNAEIKSMDYEHNKIQIQTTLKNEIGSIASHVNSLLAKVSLLNQRNIASQARLYEMEISKKQTQLYAYQSQINPHFLHNMLQCMRGISLMHGITEVAQICTNMADLFRYSIKGANLVSLEDEMNIIDKYLYMIRVRYQDKITYKINLSADTRKCKIPKMILQPLVENAIFHGLESIEENGVIYIHTYRENQELYITVQDNGIGFEEHDLKKLKNVLAEDIPSDINATFNEAKGLGVINIHNKIQLYEGSKYGLDIKSGPGNTIVTIHLNALQTL